MFLYGRKSRIKTTLEYHKPTTREYQDFHFLAKITATLQYSIGNP